MKRLPTPRLPRLRQPRLRRPRLHWPSVRGRARADAGPLLLTAVVVALISLLAGAVPALLRDTADQAVQEAVRLAGSDADVTVSARWEPDEVNGGRLRMPRLAEDVDDLRKRAISELGTGLRAVLHPPVAAVVSPTLKVTDGSKLRTVRLAYLASDTGPNVTWVSGAAPGPSVRKSRVDVTTPYFGPPWLVQVGVSEAAAKALGVGPGDRIPLSDEQRNKKNVRVSGVFRPVDRTDPAWQLAPWLLNPTADSDGMGTTRFGGLISAESLPDARLAFPPDEMQRTVRFTPDADVLTWDTAQAIAATAVKLKATSVSSSSWDTASSWNTQLDGVLRDVRGQVEAAVAQASVLLIAVLTVAVLILLLAADLLVRRRAPSLEVARRRGAALPVLGAELLLESALVTLAAAAAGLALARLAVPAVSVTWTLPVVLAATAAGPAFGVLAAARATRDKRAPANRTARRWAARTGHLRRAALELAVLAAAAAAFVALQQRGVAAGSDVALPASAPALGALVAGLVLLRLLPVVTRLLLRQALRSRRPLAVFGAARAAETSGRALPLLALVAAAALASFALTVGATVDAGLRDGAWHSVGADARIDLAESADELTPEVVSRLAAASGVRQVLTAQVTDGAPVATEEVTAVPRLVVVDAAAFQRLLAATPLPGAPDLARLARPGATPAPGTSAGTAPSPATSATTRPNSTASDPAVPALVLSADGSLLPGMRLELLRDDAPAVPLTAVGTAPAVGGAADVVLVDAAALDAAGMPAVPNTIWLLGPGAEQAAVSAADAGETVLRSEVLGYHRDAPLVTGLLRLAWASAAMLVALGLLGFSLGAAAGAPDRWQTLTRLRTLGLRPAEARRVAAVELLPLAAVAALCGPALGVLLAGATLGPLALRLLTAQTDDPAPVVPWEWLALMALLLLAAVAVVVPVESALRRRRHLAETLRVGG